MNTEAGQCEYSAVSQQGHRESCCDGQKSVTIQTPPDTPLLGKDPERDTDGGDEQDDYWGETTTAVTSERSTSMEDLALRRGSTGQQKNLANSRTKLGFYVSCVVAVCALLTPPAFITIPLLLWGPELDPCGTPCEGLYISVAFKLLLVVLASWAVFLRSPRYVMPRLVEFRALVVLLLFLFIASYWLFYGVRILGPHEKNLLGVVQYAASLVDALIFIHYLAVVLLEIRQLQPFFSLKVVRSSDGEARFYNIGILRYLVSDN
ncbi:vang-like protein 1 [Bombina bombina]|uniref:vang-like protein 1 n=1 Tax=Bombina bombina TaxID=8345 RepID=UPI00235A7824|nr:vang-like protein 1 [Bombina bombina]